jgi:hypothetical protein
MLDTTFGQKEEFRRWAVRQQPRDKLDVTVATRLPAGRFKILEGWCTRSLRRRSELLGIVLDRVLEIYEQEAGADAPLEFFVRRLHLDRDV